MASQLEETLRRFCGEIGWTYAVFWRAIGDRNPTHLVWGDGHWDRGSTATGVELLVSKIMAPQAHAFGDGIVGQAASRGNHLWILRDTTNLIGLGSKDFTELNHQFMAGIQTIAVIPVLPLGVLQLGSSQMVMENIGFVNSVVNCFAELGCARALLRGFTETVLPQSTRPYSAVSEVLPDIVTPTNKSAPINGSVHPMIHPLDKIFKQRHHLKTGQEISADHCLGYSSDSSHFVLISGRQKQVNVISQAFDYAKDRFSQAIFSIQDSKVSSSNIAQESQIFYDAISDANNVARQSKQNIKDIDTSKLLHMFSLETTLGDDLYDVLAPEYKVDNCSLNDAIVNMDDANVDQLVTHVSTCTTQLDACPISYSLIEDISGPGMITLADSDQLLEAVVSKINFGAKQISDDNSYSKTSENMISDFLLPDVSPNYESVESSKQLHEELLGVPHVLGKAGAACTSSTSLGNITEECPPTTRVCKSQINVLTEVDQSMKSDNLSGVQSKRVGEDSKLNRKRSKPGENPRGRPKDRQMIMDRVKELREIIPNGAKLSIDALLEKTIKHMLFLQSVTKHGEKLKDIGEPKFINREGNLNLKENFKGGATWACEVGTQPMACPIIVEDLNPPRQMLVEMLCEQRGLFLEIAEFIRGLGLTILKGVMEVHKDKIWARFAIEANRDVTRVEIFVSLVLLLEPSFGSSKTPQGVDKINSLHNIYNRSCIPASGPSDHLQ